MVNKNMLEKALTRPEKDYPIDFRELMWTLNIGASRHKILFLASVTCFSYHTRDIFHLRVFLTHYLQLLHGKNIGGLDMILIFRNLLLQIYHC